MKSLLSLLFACIISLLPAGCQKQPTADPATTSSVTLVKVADGLHSPSALVFLSPDQLLVAESKTGLILVFEKGRFRAAPLAAMQVAILHDMALDPDYPSSPYLYVYYTARGGGSRGVDRLALKNGGVMEAGNIISGLPASAQEKEADGRLLFGNDGMLYVTLGAPAKAELAQQPGSLSGGKVLRYRPDGGIPDDNPIEQEKTAFASSIKDGEIETTSGLRTPVYTIGHCDGGAIACNKDTGETYLLEAGQGRGDEINRLVAGDNYGWAEASGISDDPRFRSPLWSFGAVSLRPKAAFFYMGSAFPQWRGHLFFTSAADGILRRAEFDGPDMIISVQPISITKNLANSSLALGPDGTIYFTSASALYRLTVK